MFENIGGVASGGCIPFGGAGMRCHSLLTEIFSFLQ